MPIRWNRRRLGVVDWSFDLDRFLVRWFLRRRGDCLPTATALRRCVTSYAIKHDRSDETHGRDDEE